MNTTSFFKIRKTCPHIIEGKRCPSKTRMHWLRGRWRTAIHSLHHPHCPAAVAEEIKKAQASAEKSS